MGVCFALSSTFLRSTSLIELERLSQVVNEPGAATEAPRHVALPGSHNPVCDRIRTQLRVDVRSHGEWASVIKKTDIHGDLGLVDETEIKEFRLGHGSAVSIPVGKPVIRVLLEAICQRGLTVGGHCLDWIVWKTLSGIDSIN